MKTENSCYKCPTERKRATIIAKSIRRGKPSINARKRKKRRHARRITITFITGARTDMYTVFCGRVCCNFKKLSDADYFARKNGTVVFGIARAENEKGVNENGKEYRIDGRVL